MAAEKKPEDLVVHVGSNARGTRLISEALRLYERYAVEVVEQFDLCPWAARARRDGSTRPLVFLEESPDDLAPSLAAIDELTETPSIAIGFFIYPLFAVSRLDFEHFQRRLRLADSERHEIGKIPFAMAAFHPQAPADLTDADRLVPFVRRTPDPTIQLVRRDALEAVQERSKKGTAFADLWMLSPGGLDQETGPTVRERIALKNLETVRRVGVPALEAIFGDIAQDRSNSYAHLRGLSREE